LREPRSKEEYQETIQRMLPEVRKMSEIVHLLLQLSRVESAHRSKPEKATIRRITAAVGAQHQASAEARNLSTQRQIEHDQRVRAHGAYIEQVVNNLLENAIKYTPEGGQVRLQLQRSSGKAVIHLSDTGIGFDEETKKHLLERFYRANESEVQEQSGSGLGLPLVKAIIELYGGRIRAYSEGEGKGSTFVVELPLAKDKET